MIVGPWGHGTMRVNTTSHGDVDFGPNALVDLHAEEVRWLDYWLKGTDNGIVDVDGDSCFYYEEDWCAYYDTVDFKSSELCGACGGDVCACGVFYADVCDVCVCAAGGAIVLLFSWCECRRQRRGNLPRHPQVRPSAHLKTRRRPRRP